MRITVSKGYFWFLQARIALLAILFSFFDGAAAAIYPYISVLFALIGLCVYAVAALFYIRRYIISVSIISDGERMIICRGVLFQKKQIVPFKSIRFLEIKKSPLSGVFGVFKVTVNTSSLSLKIHGMDKASAEIIARAAEAGAVEAV